MSSKKGKYLRSIYLCTGTLLSTGTSTHAWFSYASLPGSLPTHVPVLYEVKNVRLLFPSHFSTSCVENRFTMVMVV
jgi:hypothetical protein